MYVEDADRAFSEFAVKRAPAFWVHMSLCRVHLELVRQQLGKAGLQARQAGAASFKAWALRRTEELAEKSNGWRHGCCLAVGKRSVLKSRKNWHWLHRRISVGKLYPHRRCGLSYGKRFSRRSSQNMLRHVVKKTWKSFYFGADSPAVACLEVRSKWLEHLPWCKPNWKTLLRLPSAGPRSEGYGFGFSTRGILEGCFRKWQFHGGPLFCKQ